MTVSTYFLQDQTTAKQFHTSVAFMTCDITIDRSDDVITNMIFTVTQKNMKAESRVSPTT